MTLAEALALAEIQQLMEDAGRALTYREIGKRLNVSPETVRTMEHMALMKLKRRACEGWRDER